MTAATELRVSIILADCTLYSPGDDDPLNLWVVLLDRLQYPDSSVDCWVKELFRLIGVHVERRSGMGDSINTLDSFIECSILTSAFALRRLVLLPYLTDVLYNDILKARL